MGFTEAKRNQAPKRCNKKNVPATKYGWDGKGNNGKSGWLSWRSVRATFG
jgi:hypothetical protein